MSDTTTPTAAPNQDYAFPENTYQDYGTDYWKQDLPTRRRFSLTTLEIILIIVTSLIVLAGIIFGFFGREATNRDIIRNNDIKQVMTALDYFYTNSSLDTSIRAYPIASCSSDPNEVDYENSLRLALTGQKKELDTYAYIQSDKFPKDTQGVYSTELKSRSIPYRCQNLLDTSLSTIYPDKWPSCNFSSTGKSNVNKCYIYTSSNTGDSYQIGYYSETKNVFVVWKKFRDQTAEQYQIKP